MRDSQARKLVPVDTVRLEVALVEHHELYGWPGSNRIAESELGTLVGGTIGNGDFGLLAQSIFQSAIFTFQGDSPVNGAPAVKYDYRVELPSSGYHLKVGVNEAVVGYHGSVWVDPESLDLMRFDLTADNIPEYLGLAASTKTLNYKREQIGQGSFLLPHDAELTMIDFSGAAHVNRTTFHSCRQYSGESVLTFDDATPESPVAPKPALRALKLPESFDSEISLLTPINSDEAAIGDAVQARLETNIKANHKTIAPKGAILSGRILKLDRLGRVFHVEMIFHSLDFEDAHADLSGRENSVTMGFATAVPQGLGLRHASYVSQQKDSRGPIVIEASRLKLPRGFLLYLQSRLVKSD